MASDTLLYYTQGFADKVKLAANSSLAGASLTSFNSKIAALETKAANLSIECAIDRKGGNPIKIITSDLIEANNETHSAYANRTRSFQQEMYSRAFEIVNTGKKIHIFVLRPNLAQLGALGAIKYAMNWPSSNNTLSNLTIWHHPAINMANTVANGGANTIYHTWLHSKYNSGVKLTRFKAHANARSSNALSQSFNHQISNTDIVIFGGNYQHANTDWDSFYDKVRYSHNNWRWGMTGYWDPLHEDCVPFNFVEFYGSYLERKMIGLSSAGAQYVKDTVDDGMKACIVGGEHHSWCIQYANTFINEYSASNVFQVRPGVLVPIEKAGVKGIGANSQFEAITANGDIIRVGDSVDYSRFIATENL